MNVLERNELMNRLNVVLEWARSYGLDYEKYNKSLGEGWAKKGFDEIKVELQRLFDDIDSIEVSK